MAGVALGVIRKVVETAEEVKALANDPTIRKLEGVIQENELKHKLVKMTKDGDPAGHIAIPAPVEKKPMKDVKMGDPPRTISKQYRKVVGNKLGPGDKLSSRNMPKRYKSVVKRRAVGRPRRYARRTLSWGRRFNRFYRRRR